MNVGDGTRTHDCPRCHESLITRHKPLPDCEGWRCRDGRTVWIWLGGWMKDGTRTKCINANRQRMRQGGKRVQ